MQFSKRISACRRELNSHEAAKPQKSSSRAAVQLCSCAGEHEQEYASGTGDRNDTTSAQLGNRNKTWYEHVGCNKEDWRRGSTSQRSAASGTWFSVSSSGRRSQHRVYRRISVAAVTHDTPRPQARSGGLRGGPRKITISWQPRLRRISSAALPNPSLKGSTNGVPPGPGRRYAVHFRQPGPGVTPSAPP